MMYWMVHWQTDGLMDREITSWWFISTLPVSIDLWVYVSCLKTDLESQWGYSGCTASLVGHTSAWQSVYWPSAAQSTVFILNMKHTWDMLYLPTFLLFCIILSSVIHERKIPASQDIAYVYPWSCMEHPLCNISRHYIHTRCLGAPSMLETKQIMIITKWYSRDTDGSLSLFNEVVGF